MLFTQVEFIVFALAVLLFLWPTHSNTLRKRFLLLASYYFYAYWDYRFLSLLLLSTITDYCIGLSIPRTKTRLSKRILLGASLLVNLGMLCFFKYFNFFIDSARSLLEPLGLHPGSLNIILPVGISFYTFQTLSYTIDIYSGKLKPCRSLWDFALFVSFFPQLVAGPIVRASEFLPQLARRPSLVSQDLFEGFRQFVFGLFKKVFFADRLAYFVDYAFANATLMSGATMWLATASYAIQIYCDFSGYSDMAIGMARAMGYRFEKNFDVPYIARSVTEFWRRWHISLSTWLRDYLYIPLGGNRNGRMRMHVNLMTTMVLGGLWHGASWSFVFWGALHGGALVVEKIIGEMRLMKRAVGEREHYLEPIRGVLGWAVTMAIVCAGWVYFRASDLAMAHDIVVSMGTMATGLDFFPPFAMGAVIAMALYHIARARGISFELRADQMTTPVALFMMIGLVILFYPKGFQPFIYFQF